MQFRRLASASHTGTCWSWTGMLSGAMKLVFVLATTNVIHIRAEERREPLWDRLDVSHDKHYVAQEWIYGAPVLHIWRHTARLTHWVHVVSSERIPLMGSSFKQMNLVTPASEHMCTKLSLPSYTSRVSSPSTSSSAETDKPPRFICVGCNPHATGDPPLLWEHPPCACHHLEHSPFPP